MATRSRDAGWDYPFLLILARVDSGMHVFVSVLYDLWSIVSNLG